MAVSREMSSHFRPRDASWTHLGPSWAILGDLGAILGHLEAILSDLGAIVGDFGLQLCVHLGSEDVKIFIFLLFFGCFCCVGLQVIDRRFSVTLLHPGGMLSPTCRIWEPTRAHFGAILSYVGATLGDVGAIVGHLEDILGAQKWPFRVRRLHIFGLGTHLGVILCHLGSSWAILGPS